MTNRIGKFISALICFAAGAALWAAPVTKSQLLAMAQTKVDPQIIQALVERDCVDFDIDAGNVAELSKTVPASVVEAAIRCREDVEQAPAAAASSEDHSRTALEVRAEFISESGTLTCVCKLDGQLFATLTKPEQGDFGQAVERTKVRIGSGLLSVSPGRHAILFRCDPGAQELKLDLDLKPGSQSDADITESMFRRWKWKKSAKP